jgi:hypothetical protein
MRGIARISRLCEEQVREGMCSVAGGRPGSRSPLPRLACLVAIGAVGALGGAQGAQAAEPCSNEAVRAEQPSSFLPECRAYELVSPPGATTYLAPD